MDNIEAMSFIIPAFTFLVGFGLGVAYVVFKEAGKVNKSYCVNEQEYTKFKAWEEAESAENKELAQQAKEISKGFNN